MEQQLAPSSGGGGGGGGGGRGVVDPSPADVSGSTPPSTSTSVVGKVLAGMGMGRFFGGGTLAEEPRSSTGAAPSIAETPSSQVTAGPAPSAATAPSVSGGGGLGAVAESPASAAARVAAASSAAAATAADGRSATTDDFQTAGEILIAPSDAGTHGGSLPQEGPTPGPRGTGPIEGAGERSSTFDAEMTGLQADSLAWRQQQGDWMRTKEDAGVGGGVTSAAAAGAVLAMEDDAVLRGRSLGPEEKQAYSDNVDRTLQVAILWFSCSMFSM